RIERAGLAFAAYAVALDVAQVRPCGRAALSRQHRQPRLDDDAAGAEGGVPVARAQHPREPGAAADPAAVEAPAANAGAPARAPRRLDHQAQIARVLAAAARPAEARHEVVVVIHRSSFRDGTTLPARNNGICRRTFKESRD